MEFENMKIFASIFLLSHNILQGKFEAKLKKIESDDFLQIHLKYLSFSENEGSGSNFVKFSYFPFS